MTPQQKLLAYQLLIGDHYLMQRVRTSGRNGYMLYKGNQVPVKYYSVAAIWKFRSF